MQGLTDRQRQILVFVIGHINEVGYPPTLREIGKEFGIRSTNGVNDHLRALARKGYLRCEDMKSRGIQVLRFPDGQKGKIVTMDMGHTRRTLKGILAEWLAEREFDGLYNDAGSCGCLLDDFMPCAAPGTHCAPGHFGGTTEDGEIWMVQERKGE